MLKWLLSKAPFGRLAVVPLSGPIFKRGIEDYLRLFKAIEEAKNIKGVLLELESPGGAATASELMFERLRRINNKKPLYCYALMAASGGYMAALGARKIYAPSTGVIGSIGVISIKPVLRELMERFGVRLEVMKKGSMKDMSLFHRESTEEEKKSWDALNEAIYERFIAIVSERRNLGRDEVKKIATGELFGAEKAKALGLIDGVGDFETVLDELSKETGVKKQRTIVIKPRRPFIKRIFSEAAGTFIEEMRGHFYL